MPQPGQIIDDGKPLSQGAFNAMKADYVALKAQYAALKAAFDEIVAVLRAEERLKRMPVLLPTAPVALELIAAVCSNAPATAQDEIPTPLELIAAAAVCSVTAQDIPTPLELIAALAVCSNAPLGWPHGCRLHDIVNELGAARDRDGVDRGPVVWNGIWLRGNGT